MTKSVFALLSVSLFCLLVASSCENKSQKKEIQTTTIGPATPTPAYELVSYPDPNPHTQKLISEYEEYIARAIEAGWAPGAAVAIIKDTSVIFVKGFGYRESGSPKEIDINTVFRLGSVSKCFASVLAGTLVNDHLINWDDPVVKHLPDFELKSKEFTEKLTIRHVLSHTMGLPYHAFTNMVEEHIPLDTLLDDLRDVDLVGAPGTVYSYQNVGYSLIGKIAETVTHKSFEALLKEKVFQPLHMNNSSASFNAIMSSANVALPHQFVSKQWKPVAISDTYYNVSPAGGVNASISDMAAWLRSLLGHQDLMQDSTLNEIFTPQVKAVSKNRNFSRWQRPRASYYALGWRVITFKSDTIEYHGGYVNGYRSEVALDRKNKIAICVLTNSAGSLADQSIPEFFRQYSLRADSIQLWDKRSKIMLVKTNDTLTPEFFN